MTKAKNNIICPHCGHDITDSITIQQAGSIVGRRGMSSETRREAARRNAAKHPENLAKGRAVLRAKWANLTPEERHELGKKMGAHWSNRGCLTLKQIGDIVGISAVSVCLWFKGKHTPKGLPERNASAEDWQKFAEVFNKK